MPEDTGFTFLELVDFVSLRDESLLDVGDGRLSLLGLLERLLLSNLSRVLLLSLVLRGLEGFGRLKRELGEGDRLFEVEENLSMSERLSLLDPDLGDHCLGLKDKGLSSLTASLITL